MWEDVEEILDFVTKEIERSLHLIILGHRYGSEEWLQLSER